MRQLLTITARTLSPPRMALALALLAGVAATCLLVGAATRRYTVAPDRLRFDGEAISAGLNNLEQTDAFGPLISYRWTNGAARIVLPNPGGPIIMRLQLAIGRARSSEVTLATDHNQLGFTVSGDPRSYQVLLAPEPDELINLQINSPTFAEAGSSRRLGVLLAQIDLRGGGAPVRVVLISTMLAGLALYLIWVGRLGPLRGAGLALLAQVAALVWYSGPGWTQGIFAALQALGVAGAALAMLGFELAQGGIDLRRSARPDRISAVAQVALMATFLSSAIWTQVAVIPDLASDLGIYLAATARALGGGDPYQPFLIGVSYVYPPPALALFAPFNALAFPAAELGWRILSVLAIAGSALALRRAFAVATPAAHGTIWLLALVVSFAPLWESLSIGQVNPLVLLGLSLFILGAHEREWAWVGDLGLAGAIMLKISPLLLLALPLLRGDWRRCLRVGVGLVGIALISLPWFGPQRWAEFVNIVPQLFQGSNDNPYNVALAAVGFRLGPLGALLGRVFAGGLLLLWLLLCAWDRRGDPRRLLALGVLAMTLGSSLIWYHHLIFLGVPAAWLLLGSTRRGPALATLLGLSLVQISRLVEFGLGLGPWPAVAGYGLVLAAAVVGMRQAAQPDPV